jgi:pyrimidine-specific ribonucleoside hydrolase
MTHRPRLIRGVGLVLSVALAATACGASDVGGPSVSTPVFGNADPVSVIVDYSPTVSDVGALLYLLSHSSLEVVAVTLPVTGEAGCALGLEVTLGILAMFDREDIPVACDSDMPADARTWPPEFLTGHENLMSGLPRSTAKPKTESPSDLIARVVGEARQPVVLYAVAPLTNVAKALRDHPNLVFDLDRIVIMGGAVEVPGNVQGRSAEWNFWIDVAAANSVIASGAPITLVPLDATNDVPVPPGHELALDEATQSKAVVYLARLLDLIPSATSDFYFMWDELAASVASGEPSAYTEVMTIEVVVGGEHDGRTVERDDGQEIDVGVRVDDPETFHATFVSILADGPK